MRIHAIQAFEGDSLLIESGDANPRFVLIDAGPRGTYDAHVRAHLLDTLGAGGPLDAVIVSHVDKDHIVGVLDLVADLERAGADGEFPAVKVADLWHNSFSRTLDNDEGNLVAGLQEMMNAAGRAQVAMSVSGAAFLGIREGALLRRAALKLGIPLNDAFGGKLISPDEIVQPNWSFGDVTFQVVGPTDANLRELRKEWEEWLDQHLDAFAEGDVQAMSNADRSVPNLSSIVILASSPSGTALLTGDARGDHILQGLEAAGLLDDAGKLHVDVLKVQHHGSDRNVTKRFFQSVTADVYLISADGKNGNPDIATLKWLVDAAHEQDRQPRIVVTNATSSLEQLVVDRPPDQFGYSLETRSPDANAIVVDVGA
jgi:beta-lactamase superfamily II metal-dependent hydrolase